MAEKRDMNVAIDPEILAVIQASNAVSTQKGSSAALLKIGAKRRRTRAEIDEHRAREADMRAHQQSQKERIAELEREVNRSKQKLQSAQESEGVVSELVNQGYLVKDAAGQYSLAQPEERKE